MQCPRCDLALTRVSGPNGLSWRCARCQGRVATLAVLKKSTVREGVSVLWQRVVAGDGSLGIACPGCHSNTQELPAIAGESHPLIDVCRNCQCLWFDAREFEDLPAPVVSSPQELDVPQEVREALALRRVDAIAKEAERERMAEKTPDHWWQYIPAILGMPVERPSEGIGRYPLVTWSLAAITLVVSIAAFLDLGAIARGYGFVPRDALRLGGLTAFTAFFLHGDFGHLLGNLYYLVVFGDNVEDRLGHWRYALLLVGAIVVGKIGYWVLDPYSGTPLIGASGGVSGVIAYYACAFPRARVGFFVWYLFRMGFVWVPMAVAIVIWVLMQGIGVWMQSEGLTNVSAVSHLGGAAVGLVMFAVVRFRER